MVRDTIRHLIEEGRLSTWLDEDEHVESFETIRARLSQAGAGGVDLDQVRKIIVSAIAFLSRDSGTERLQKTVDDLIPMLVGIDATLRAALAASPSAGEPVAWIKRWMNDNGTLCERVDLTSENEPWLRQFHPKVTPLYATPPAPVQTASVEAEAFWQPWRISHVLADCATYFRTLYKKRNIGPANRGIDPDKLDEASKVAASLTAPTQAVATVTVDECCNVLDFDKLIPFAKLSAGKHNLYVTPSSPVSSPSPAGGVREAAAELIDQMLVQEPYKNWPQARMSLTIAARAIRRGRHLTEAEKTANVMAALSEDDDQ